MPALLHHAVPFLLVLSRLGGLFVFAPMLASTSIPVRVRAIFAVMFAAVLFPLVPPSTPAGSDLDLVALFPSVATEALIGVSIGLLAAIPIFSVQLAGLVMGQQMGLGLAGVYNPALESESDTLSEMLLYVALGVFVAIGGLDALFLGVARSFARVPLGAFASSHVPLESLRGLTAAGFELALRVAAPVTCIVLLETIASGVLMRTVPQLNIMSIGFALKIILGLTALVAALSAIHQTVGEAIVSTLRLILDWSGSI